MNKICIFILLMLLVSFRVFAADEGDSSLMEGPLPQNEYGTVIAMGREVSAQDTSTSIVVDWRDLADADVSAYAAAEDSFIFKSTVRTDGYRKGEALGLEMKVKYHPEAETPSPCVVLIPGGGFQTASPDSLAVLQRYFAIHGYAVAAFSYRVIGEGLYSDAAEDINDAIRFVRANAEKYNIDPDRLALLGNSAGGYFAALVGASQDNGAFGADELSSVKAVVDLYGLSDLTQVAMDYDEEVQAAYYDTRTAPSQYVNGVFTEKTIYETPESAAASNPLTYINGSEPPFLIMHGSSDTIVSPSQSILVHNALLENGVESIRYSLTGSEHGRGGFDSETALRIMVDFLDERV